MGTSLKRHMVGMEAPLERGKDWDGSSSEEKPRLGWKRFSRDAKIGMKALLKTGTIEMQAHLKRGQGWDRSAFEESRVGMGELLKRDQDWDRSASEVRSE